MSARAAPGQLPFQPTPLIGRTREIGALCHLLRQPHVRMLTLSGPGGVGKTRLALRVAGELIEDFDHAVYFVALDSISDPHLVIPMIARTFGIHEASGPQPLDALINALRDRRLLLLIDNFEHVIAAAPALSVLIAGCPEVRLLVTSRQVLQLRSEYEFPVPPLALPDQPRRSGPAALLQYEAIALFVERAQAHKPDFALTEDNAEAVRRLCTRLDGLPLAIELAAARIKVLTPQSILDRLDRRFQLLSGGPADLPARQQTLRNAIGWSYDLLDPDDQRLLRRLSIFAGGWTLDGAQVLSGFHDGESVLDRLTSLINKSLIWQAADSATEPRYRMLETIREYGLEQLAQAGELEDARQVHAGYFLRLVAQAEPHLVGAQQEQWLARLDSDHDNLRAALGWLLERGDRAEAIRIAGAVWRYWLIRAYLGEGSRWLEAALAAPEAGSPAERAKALAGAGILNNYLGDYHKAETFLRQSLAHYRAIGDAHGMALALPALAQAITVPGNYADGALLMQEAINLMRQSDDDWGLANSLWYYGNLLWMRDDAVPARAAFEESLQIHHRLNNVTGSVYVEMNLGFIDMDEGDYAQALVRLNKALAGYQRDRRGITRVLYGLGMIAFLTGDLHRALAYDQDCIAILYELGDRFFMANLLEAIAGVAIRSEEPEPAARIFGASEALREATPSVIMPRSRALYDQLVDEIRAQLPTALFETCWREGRALTQEQALALAQSLTIAAEPPEAGKAPSDLTPREVEVLRLLSEGLTNQQIADRLVISARTINTHLTSIFSKLGVSTRAAATRYAVDHHLV